MSMRGTKLIEVVYNLGSIISIRDPQMRMILDNVGLNHCSPEENLIWNKLQNDLQKFIVDNWERGDFTHEVEMAGMTSQFDNWDIEWRV